MRTYRKNLELPSRDEGSYALRAIGVHDAIGARIAEQQHFDAVWASGLEISTSLGLPDADLVGFSESTRAVDVILSATDLPVIVDCDAGYGNAMNVHRMADHYFRAGAAALCLEDKVFPKMNSFADHEHELATVDEMTSKLRAMSDQRSSASQLIIARTEALIADLGVDAALERAHQYEQAGADAILVHDKSSHGEQLLEFAERWDSALPLVCVPTTYYKLTWSQLTTAGFSLVIYANQGLRAEITAMKSVMRRILQSGSSLEVESEIAPISDVFEIQRLLEHQNLFRSFEMSDSKDG